VSPYLKKNPSQKRADRIDHGLGPSSNPSTKKKKKKERNQKGVFGVQEKTEG
jgi:hypothetical protein